MKIHKEGWGFLIKLFAFLLSVNVSLFYLYSFPSFAIFFLFIISFLVFLFFLQFFRSPKIIKTVDEKLIVSPANGEVVHIGEVFEGEYYKEKKLLISIFMSPFDVHINRNPIGGEVKYYKYHKGKYLVAWHPKSSTKNERTTTVIANNKISVLVRQIAGLVARRIINYSVVGKTVNQSNQLGFIKFGSRADIFLPLDFKPEIRLKQKTTAGVTVLGKLH
ncbi:MAG: phosphatidylserine decarboxylase family protein [Rhodothermaeota bacterium MED-G19]|nr:MAG: phosphatidylserine decarboxylase family protein [Rhodothermaeota bacterium MED-G19]